MAASGRCARRGSLRPPPRPGSGGFGMPLRRLIPGILTVQLFTALALAESLPAMEPRSCYRDFEHDTGIRRKAPCWLQRFAARSPHGIRGGLECAGSFGPASPPGGDRTGHSWHPWRSMLFCSRSARLPSTTWCPDGSIALSRATPRPREPARNPGSGRESGSPAIGVGTPVRQLCRVGITCWPCWRGLAAHLGRSGITRWLLRCGWVLSGFPMRTSSGHRCGAASTGASRILYQS